MVGPPGGKADDGLRIILECRPAWKPADSPEMMLEALLRHAPIVPADMSTVYRFAWNETFLTRPRAGQGARDSAQRDRRATALAVVADMPVAAG